MKSASRALLLAFAARGIDATAGAARPSSSRVVSSDVRHLTMPTPVTRVGGAGWNLRRTLDVRGGGAVDVLQSDDEDELSNGEVSDLELDSEEDESSDEDDEPAQSSAAAGPPVKLSVTTSLSSPLLDRTIEFAASRKRTVESLRQAVSRTMPGRPPLSSVTLRYQGRALDDSETVADIVDEMEEDGDEAQLADDIGDEDETLLVSLSADIVPPAEAKFGTEMGEKASRMSTDEILEGYCLNMAGLLYGQELQAKESEEYERFLAGGEAGVGDEDSEAEEETSDVNVNHSLNIRKRAAVLRAQLERSLSETTLQLLREETERIDEEGRDGATFGLVSKEALEAARRNRKGRSVRGGAAMNVKRALQRNLNVVSVLFFYSSRDALPRRKLLLLFFVPVNLQKDL